MDAPDDLKSHVSSLITSGVSPLEIVVVSEHPEYHGELYFEVFEGQAAFATRYRDWVSAYSVLSELYNLTAFLTRLQTEGWQVVFDPGTKKILQDFQRWSEPVLVEGYTLHGFQQFSLNRARETDTWFFNWATGAGKSFTCAAGAKWLIDMGEIDQVIACTLPKSKIDMLRFFEYAGLDVVINDGDKARRGRGYAAQHQVYVANYEKLRVDYEQLLKLVSGRRVLWIFDECHKLISGDVDFNGIPKFNQARQSFEKLIRACGGGSKVWPMSASVVDGNPLRFRDVFSLGKGVRNPLGLRSEFEQHYADEIKTFDVKTGKKRRDGTDKTFPLVHHDWNLIRLQDVRHRVGDRTQTARKTDPGLVHLFKGLQTIVEPVQPSREEHAIFQAIIDLAWDAYQRHENLGPYYSCLRIAANTPAALLHTTHDFAADIAKDFNLAEKPPMSSKLEKLNEKLESIRESGDQVLVFTHWTNLSLHIIKDFLTVPSVAHWGTGQSDKESQRAKDEFTSNSDITCFLTSDAGAHGMNAQNARYVIQLEPTYSYDLSMQRASRIDRSDSHLDGLTNYVMLTDESVETRVWDIQNARRIVSGVTQGTNEVHSYSPQDLARAKQPEHSNLPFLLFGDRF